MRAEAECQDSDVIFFNCSQFSPTPTSGCSMTSEPMTATARMTYLSISTPLPLCRRFFIFFLHSTVLQVKIFPFFCGRLLISPLPLAGAGGDSRRHSRSHEQDRAFGKYKKNKTMKQTPSQSSSRLLHARTRTRELRVLVVRCICRRTGRRRAWRTCSGSSRSCS
jgi:hypothetical protein